MSTKRSRATYEADLQAKQSPYAVYGTPLPPRDSEVRDDGSYVPIWKQEVRDERGLKRLHGAFTGGFSAGYFNTVGSKEGWTPATFVSSRTNRRKDGPKQAQQRPEDFMDEEDLADAAEAQRVQTSDNFSGLGSIDGPLQGNAFLDIFKTHGETMGVKLLKRMGWKEGQGVGPKVRRRARLDGAEIAHNEEAPTHLFAPENTRMISFIKKNDHKGLGFEGETRLSLNDGSQHEKQEKSENDEEFQFGTAATKVPKKKKSVRGGIGIGILNDTGSDDEDPYEIGPRISYNRIIGGEKKKKKVTVGSTNPSLTAKPVFISKKAALAKATNLRKCHDGRLPLDGFILSTSDGSLTVIEIPKAYLPPEVPKNWKSSRQPKDSSAIPAYLSTAEAAKLSKLDPKSRAAILGEAVLPGKSVFDFLSPSARDRIVSATGKADLPQGLGEIPEGYAMTAEERQRELTSQIPKVEKYIAVAALNRGASGFMPYGEDEAKRNRYRSFLEYQADITKEIPPRGNNMSKDEWLQELREFANCAQIFKPMSGMMATRFTSSTKPGIESKESGSSVENSLLSKPAPKPEDPAEAAAKIGMYGPLTRSSQDWYPTRLLCKRFNVQPPAHVRVGGDEDTAEDARKGAKDLDLVSQSAINEMLGESGSSAKILYEDQLEKTPAPPVQRREIVIDAEKNEALEGQKAGEAVFKAIFGDDSDEDEYLQDKGRGSALYKRAIGEWRSTKGGRCNTQEANDGPAVGLEQQLDINGEHRSKLEEEDVRARSPPPGYPVSEASGSAPPSPRPPPFSSLYTSTAEAVAAYKVAVTEVGPSGSVPAYAPVAPDFHSPADTSTATSSREVAAEDETKAALPQDTKGESSSKEEDSEPPPAYSLGTSPLESFTYVMAAAGGAASIITQVQQGGAPPINTLGDVGPDENITMDLRGTKFTLSRDELLTLPEFVLLSLFPNGLLPDGHLNAYHDSDAFQVDYDPASLQYMLDFFRNVANTIPDGSTSPSTDGDPMAMESMGGSTREMLQDRAGIIVLREDLDFYAIPPRPDIEQPEMIEVKRAAGRALLKQDGIFSGLRKSDEAGSTEQHLIEMLTAGGFNHDDCWGHRAGEPNKAVICSLALARLRTDIRATEMGGNAVGMAQKLLLFWRKPARRCWWEGVELEDVEGVEGKLKVWIRRVWTLEMSVIGLR
ncbi:hypothetical protein F5884DRAFT_858125 [Xylogone sp. PMI_703]|nr:hypothetical protein F5884DRAFT_858125 [Xylogone sp. PMI_703]